MGGMLSGCLGDIKLERSEAKIHPDTCCTWERRGPDRLSHGLIVTHYLFNIGPTDTSITSAHSTNWGRPNIAEIEAEAYKLKF